ncbi:MAG: YybH family protein [Woeseiaceae bacterium]
MTTSAKLGLYAVMSLSWAAGNAIAQDAPSDQSAVWSVIEEQWERNESGDTKWIDEMLTADFAGWPNEAPAPQSRASIRMWDALSSKQTEGLEHELYPLSIVVHGDMAIAHYLYTNATRDKKGEVEVRNGRYTDVLVRDDDIWKFISWHGGDEAGDD